MSISYGGDYITDTDGGVLRPSSAVMRNRIINGDMRIDQRNAGASVSVSNANVFCVDRFYGYSTTPAVFSLQQVNDAPAGFINSLKMTTTTTDASLAASDFNALRHNIEGLNIADLGWGTASAKTITVSFWVKSSLTGTFNVSLRNADVSRSYVATYTINSANTWEYETITIPGDTSGTWLTTNGIGIRLEWNLGTGSDFQGTAGAWATANDIATSGSTSVIGTNGATWQVTGVQLEKGSSATGFEYRQYGTEFLLCQRYLPSWIAGQANGAGIYGSAYATTNVNFCYPYIVQPRVSPTGITTSGTFSLSDGNNVQNTTTVTFGGGGTCASFLDFVGTGFTTYRPMYFYGNSSAKILFTGCEL